eukprot:366091-Chlamydomonas_euryale.AAC.5
MGSQGAPRAAAGPGYACRSQNHRDSSRLSSFSSSSSPQESYCPPPRERYTSVGAAGRRRTVGTVHRSEKPCCKGYKNPIQFTCLQ